jgi:hypothetical protein
MKCRPSRSFADIASSYIAADAAEGPDVWDESGINICFQRAFPLASYRDNCFFHKPFHVVSIFFHPNDEKDLTLY